MDIKLQCLTIALPHMHKIILLNVYRPPQGDTSIFKKIVSDSVNQVKSKDNTEVYLLGDMNINFGDKKSQVVKELETSLKAHGLKQLIKDHTRLTATSRSTLDLIFTYSEYIANSGCLGINISDHLATFFTLKKTVYKTN